jgi:predicted permease
MKFWSFWRSRRQELQDEIQNHLRMAAADRLDRGSSAREAESAARREFGNVGLVMEVTRDQWRWTWLEDLLGDVRYGLRTLRRSPGFTAVVILTLALGIGANSAIFSLIDAALLSRLPVRDADRLVLLEWRAHKELAFESYMAYGECRTGQTSGCSFSAPFFREVKARGEVFSSVAAFAGANRLSMSGNGPASVIDNAEYVSGDFFETLGIQPAAGRLISPEDDTPSSTPVVVLNYDFWQNQFGGLPAAIGKTIFLNKVACTIVGVAEPRFNAPAPGTTIQMWIPLSVQPRLQLPWDNRELDPKSWYLTLVGRLKPGTPLSQAQAVVNTLFHNEVTSGAKPMAKPEDAASLALLPAEEGLIGDRPEIATPFYLLMFAVGVVLLIACANIAGLLLSRATTRTKEMALRATLGASAGRIVRQLLTESLVLSLAGGALGILFASWVVAAIMAFIVQNQDGRVPFIPAINVRVLLFTLGVSNLTGILFGLAPALRGIRVNLMPALKEGSGSSAPESGGARRWLAAGNGLVVLQMTLSIVVLAGAGLLVRTLQNLKRVDPGFETRNLLTFRLDPTLLGYSPESADNLYRDLQTRLSSFPGVRSVSYSWTPLLSGWLWTTTFQLPGNPKDKGSDSDMFAAGPDFFQTMGIPLLSGRAFGPRDFEVAQAAAAARAAKQAQAAAELKSGTKSKSPAQPANLPPVPLIVNHAFVQHYFPNQNPLGLRLAESHSDQERSEQEGPGWEIIGVVADAKYNSLRREVKPTAYVPNSGGGVSFLVRTSGEPAQAMPQIRSLVAEMDSNLPVFDVKTETERIDGQIFQERLIARLSGFFGALALLLACVGLYGLVSYEVARRTREIGIRAALGANKRELLRMVLLRGMILSLLGAAFGTGLALAVTRFAKSLLYGVGAADPLTFGGVALLLIAVTLAACYIPARRATRVDPVVALRYE